MKERPILFSGPMVNAILEGRKTQTRRVVKPHRDGVITGAAAKPGTAIEAWGGGQRHNASRMAVVGCPYGVPGDRLWVREKWRDCNYGGAPGLIYAADGDIRDLMLESEYLCEDRSMNYDHPHIAKYQWDVWYTDVGCGEFGHGWKPSIHMPRWASRITLEIKSVRVERLQDISEDDAKAEGIECVGGPTSCEPWKDYGKTGSLGRRWSSPVSSFRSLWDSINGKPHIQRDDEGREIGRTDLSWNANPWVWVVEFERADT